MIQQRPIADRREELEADLRLMLTDGIPAGPDGYPLPSLIRKADTVVQQILRLVDQYYPSR